MESLLTHTKSLGLRNAIRLTLRDLYKQTGQKDKVLQLLRDLLKENDAAAARGLSGHTRATVSGDGKPRPSRRPGAMSGGFSDDFGSGSPVRR